LELLGEGTYTRSDGGSGEITATVSPGQLGAYMELEWSFNTFRTFMVWDVVESADGGSYTTVDSDDDGIPGHALVAGPFVGITLIYDFIVGTPPPDIEVTINTEGGSIQECSETGGSTVSLNAAVNLVGGAEVGSIEWYVDGESAGSGETITPYLTLGDHTVDVLATAVIGESDTDSVTVTVRDTTPPKLTVAFLNQAGLPINEVVAGTYVTAQISPNDICDPTPVSGGSAVPVFEVVDGDTIKIQSGKISTVELPTTAIELSGSATDASGNTTTGMAVLSIID
jgi:hypothetical protein